MQEEEELVAVGQATKRPILAHGFEGLERFCMINVKPTVDSRDKSAAVSFTENRASWCCFSDVLDRRRFHDRVCVFLDEGEVYLLDRLCKQLG